MMDYGTKVVAGVTPGKGGQKFEDTVPVFDTVDEAVAAHRRQHLGDLRAARSPPDAICEAADAGCKLIVCITEGVPRADMVEVMPYLQERGVRLIGPNCPGLIAPAEQVASGHPARQHRQAGPGGRGLAQRHADLRGGLPADRARASASPPASASAATR